MKDGGSFGNTKVDGLNGTQCNFIDLKDSSKGTYCVNKNAIDVCQ